MQNVVIIMIKFLVIKKLKALRDNLHNKKDVFIQNKINTSFTCINFDGWETFGQLFQSQCDY